MPHRFIVSILLFCFGTVLSITILACITCCAVENFANLTLLKNSWFTETDSLPSILNEKKKQTKSNYVRMCNQTKSMNKFRIKNKQLETTMTIVWLLEQQRQSICMDVVSHFNYTSKHLLLNTEYAFGVCRFSIVNESIWWYLN